MHRESEKVGQLALGTIVPVSAGATLESGLERVKFDSKHTIVLSCEPIIVDVDCAQMSRSQLAA